MFLFQETGAIILWEKAVQHRGQQIVQEHQALIQTGIQTEREFRENHGIIQYKEVRRETEMKIM